MRLIDADALDFDNVDFYDPHAYYDVCDIIDNSPTIENAKSNNWIPIENGMPEKGNYNKDFLLTVKLDDGRKTIIKAEFSAFYDRVNNRHFEAFCTSYAPCVGINYTEPYNFYRPIPTEKIMAYMPIPEPYNENGCKQDDVFELVIRCKSHEELCRVTEWIDKTNLFAKCIKED